MKATKSTTKVMLQKQFMPLLIYLFSVEEITFSYGFWRKASEIPAYVIFPPLILIPILFYFALSQSEQVVHQTGFHVLI